MAPSLINTVAVAAAFAAGASATKSYKIADKFNAANFYDKWDFVTVSFLIECLPYAASKCELKLISPSGTGRSQRRI